MFFQTGAVNGGGYRWYIGTSEKMTMLKTGLVGIGTTGPNAGLEIVTDSGAFNAMRLVSNRAYNLGTDVALVFRYLYDTTNFTSGGLIVVAKDNNTISNQSGNMQFYTNNAGSVAEKLRITSGGFTKMSSTGTYNTAASYHEIRANTAGNWTAYITNIATSDPYGIIVDYTGASPNGTQNEFFFARDTGGTRFGVRSNGGIANYQANDVNLSDERTKKDIISLESYWDKFKAIEIVKFKYKDQTHDDFNIGVIAQQVESIAPEFIDIDGWDNKPKLDEEGNEIISEEEPLKSVYTSDLHHATIKVLQEAMAKIEILEKEVEILKAK